MSLGDPVTQVATQVSTPWLSILLTGVLFQLCLANSSTRVRPQLRCHSPEAVLGSVTQSSTLSASSPCFLPLPPLERRLRRAGTLLSALSPQPPSSEHPVSIHLWEEAGRRAGAGSAPLGLSSRQECLKGEGGMEPGSPPIGDGHFRVTPLLSCCRTPASTVPGAPGVQPFSVQGLQSEVCLLPTQRGLHPAVQEGAGIWGVQLLL